MNDHHEVLDGLQRVTGIEIAKDSHHFIVLSQLNAWMEDRAAPFAKGVLLDYGCGGQPYRALLEKFAARYLGADVAAAAGITLDVLLEPGCAVPLPDESVDTVVSTQTLEHVYDFHGYLAESRRLLRPSGHLILSVPMQWRHHEVPFDFWRFTRFGLERSLQDAGFRIVDLSPCGRVYSLIGQIFLNHLSETGKLRPWMASLVNRFSIYMDRKTTDIEDTLVWMCLAKAD